MDLSFTANVSIASMITRRERMGLYQGEHCKGCGRVLEKPELDRGWDVCFDCGYQINGDFDMLEHLPPKFEPTYSKGD